MNEVFNKGVFLDKELVISHNETVLTGSWFRNGMWLTDVDITSIPFSHYHEILKSLQQNTLVIGFLKNEQHYYGILLNQEKEVEAYAMGFNLLNVLDYLNGSLYSMQEQNGLKR